jgi:NADH-quinone oxidoreductase subunit C
VAPVARPLSPPDVAERLRARFGDDVVAADDQFGHAVVTVNASRYHEVVKMCRDEPEFACDYCDFVGGVDRGDDGFEVVTHLFSTRLLHNVRVKVPLPHDEPAIDTISDLYAGANWHERELREMFGIEVTGHPQPVKLLLPEPFEGHPLRKDFPLMSRVAKPWPGDSEVDADGETE